MSALKVKIKHQEGKISTLNDRISKLTENSK